MEHEVSVDAPGKILWIGGYSVLERPHTSFVTAASSHVHVYANKLEGREVRFNAPIFNLMINGVIGEDGRIDVQVPAQLNLVKTAAEMAARFAVSMGYSIHGFSIETQNDNQFAYSIGQGPDSKITKSGLGSSAAVTVGTVAAVLANMDVDLNGKSNVHKLAQLAHALATDKVGSGFDIAASTYGSMIYTRYSPHLVKNLKKDYTNSELIQVVKQEWDYSIEQMRMPETFESLFANFVGKGALTVSLVTEVNKFKDKDPDAYWQLVRQINESDKSAILALRRMNENNDTNGYLETFKQHFDQGRMLTKELGRRSGIDIESDQNTKLIEDSKQHGALVAKLPGAGGDDAIVALCLDAARRDSVREFWSSNPRLDVLNLQLNNSGVKIKQAKKVTTK